MMEENQERRERKVSQIEVEKIRATGKELVDFSQNLLRIKRERIHRALKRTLSIPIAFATSLVLLIALIFQLVVKNILKPLALIQHTTEDVAKGNYTPIPYEAGRKDEISELIAAFNKMAGEIESRQEEVVQSRKIAAIGTFTSGIAHELNNPINNIYLTAETLLEDYTDLSEAEANELILDVLNQADRAADIVKNLLDFSRSEPPSFANLSIAMVLDSTVKLVKNQIMVAGIGLKKNLPDDVPDIRGNLRNLQHVFLNLLLNAIQAMPGGGSIEIEVSQDSSEYIRVDVKDTGKGIKPEDLERIFDPFFTTKGVGRGTGLGLSVTYSIVKTHGGYIEVKSEVNLGTTFSVFLPVEERQVLGDS
jgi:signal transduction histidine kinase